ncbi:MAG TPA: ABC transporter permease subunit [Candidatus Baltobacteraceae bacterium]|jgi:ABC-type nitrate/sulfonate/bicarbonate transport system permease component|nr:ABC transporter permease subunit [Candidatus Baltobacteraceae bacterium]
MKITNPDERRVLVRNFLLAVLGTSFAGLAWEAFAAFAHNPGLVPPLERVLSAFQSWRVSGLLLGDLLESLPRAWASLLMAAPIGVSMGLLLGLSETTRRLFDSTLQFMRSLPPVALLPLFIIWFGIDYPSKLFASTFVCIFPIAVTTTQGVMIADSQYRELGNDLGLSKMDYVLKVIMPATAVAVVPGLRLSAGTAFIMLYISELAGASSGLGYRISIAQLAYQADLMIAGLLVLGLAALGTDLLIQRLSRSLLHYAGRT